jgi:hypothetical protein
VTLAPSRPIVKEEGNRTAVAIVEFERTLTPRTPHYFPPLSRGMCLKDESFVFCQARTDVSQVVSQSTSHSLERGVGFETGYPLTDRGTLAQGYGESRSAWTNRFSAILTACSKVSPRPEDTCSSRSL